MVTLAFIEYGSALVAALIALSSALPVLRKQGVRLTFWGGAFALYGAMAGAASAAIPALVAG